MKFNKILFKELMKENSLNQQKIADELTRRGEKISLAGVKQWTKKENPAIPTFEKLKILGDIFKIEPLLLIESEIFKNINTALKIKAFDKYSNSLDVPMSMIKNLDIKYLRTYNVNDTSLEPKFSIGDVLLLDIIENRKNFKKENGLYLVEYKNFKGIKYITFLDDNKIELYKIDKSEPEITNSKDYKIIAKVCDKIIINYEGLKFE